MHSPFAKFFVVTLVGVLTCLDVGAAQETSPVVLEPYGKEFIFTAGSARTIYVVTRDKAGDGEKPRLLLDSVSIGLGTLPADLQELPGIKLEYQGTKYVLPTRKIIMVAAEPKEQGVYVRAALDPNGTGNYEVQITVNWPDWPDKDKKINFLSRLLPESLKVVENSASWSRPKGGLSWTATLVFHNGTGRPLILDQGYFENLPTNEGWPEIIVPPAE